MVGRRDYGDAHGPVLVLIMFDFAYADGLRVQREVNTAICDLILCSSLTYQASFLFCSGVYSALSLPLPLGLSPLLPNL